MFCKSCGAQIDDNSKFCSACGKRLIEEKTNYSKMYDGKIKKCPSCGASINAYEIKCNNCGYEFREMGVSKSLDEFSRKIASIDEMKYKRPDMDLSEITDIKVSYIGSFAIPNNKEDLLEFMILASSNIKTNNINSKDYKKIAPINQAWMAKMEQVYEKAKLALINESEFAYIDNIYQNKKKEIEKLELKIKRQKMLWPIYFLVAILFCIIGYIDKNNNGILESLGMLMLSIGVLILTPTWMNELFKYDK